MDKIFFFFSSLTGVDAPLRAHEDTTRACTYFKMVNVYTYICACVVCLYSCVEAP